MTDDRDRELLALALVGSRARGFHHDVASKLQRLIMAHAELDELVPATAEPRAAVDGLGSALVDLEALFADYRALTKGGEVASVDLRTLLEAAARRGGLALEAEIPDVSVLVAEPELIQLLCGLAEDRPTLAARGTLTGDRLTLAIACVPPPAARALAERLLGATATATGMEISLPLSK